VQNIILVYNMYTIPLTDNTYTHYLQYTIDSIHINVLYKKWDIVWANESITWERGGGGAEQGVPHSYSRTGGLEGWLHGGARKAPTEPSPFTIFSLYSLSFLYTGRLYLTYTLYFSLYWQIVFNLYSIFFSILEYCI